MVEIVGAVEAVEVPEEGPAQVVLPHSLGGKRRSIEHAYITPFTSSI